MSRASKVTVPTARSLRTSLGRARRARRAAARAAGEAPAADWYTVGLAGLVLGGLLVQGVRRVSGTPAPDVPHLGWLLSALLLVAAGVAMRGVIALGPIFAGPAVWHWVFATPVDRRALLTPRYLAVATGAVALGAGTAAVAAVVAEAAEPLWWTVTGAGVAAGLFAAAVLLQPGPVAVGRVASIGVASTGAVLAGAALVAAPDVTLPALPGSVVAVTAAVLAAVLLAAGWQQLGRLDRAVLGAGSGLAVAVQAAGTFLDPALLLGLLEERRWRAMRRGPSQPGIGVGRATLVYADVRQALRTPGMATFALGLLLVPYAGAAMLPAAVVPAVSAVAACLVASRVAGGLRAVVCSPALRRALASTDRTLVAVHLVAPLAVTAVWTAAALPALLPIHPLAVVLLPVGAVVVVLRTATRPALNYGAAVFDTGISVVPIDLIRQLLRGPALLGILVAAHLLLAS